MLQMPRIVSPSLVLIFAVLACTVPNADAASFQIAVLGDGWGSATAREIRAITLSAADEIARNVPRTRIGTIVVYHRDDHPLTAWERTPDGKISVGLQARDRQCAQIAFQFAHEFCHVLITHSGDSRRTPRTPGGANLWLEESLAETASLFALHAMSRSWERSAPFRGWRSYAPEFSDYAQNRMRSADAGGRSDFTRWFGKNEPTMRRNAELRDSNLVVALQLLPLFEAEPRGWEAVTFMNPAAHDPRQPLGAFLAEWRQNCPPTLRPFVTGIAAVFGIAM